jgi:hypothetical protein
MANLNPKTEQIEATRHDNLDPKVAKKWQSNGGKKSGEVRRERRDIKEKLELVFDILNKKESREVDDKDMKEVIDTAGYDVYRIWKILNDKESSPSDILGALKLIWSYKYGMPKQSVDTNVSQKISITEVKDLLGDSIEVED